MMMLSRRLWYLPVTFCFLSCLILSRAHLSSLEEEFIKLPSNDSAKAHLKYITSEAHIAGTPGDLKMANYVADQFRGFGIEAEIQAINVLLTYPNSRSLRMISVGSGEPIWEAALEEKVLPSDATSDTEWRHKTFLAYTPSGDVKAPLVYANYGRPEDFTALDDMGVSVEGRIVIVRYGKCFRGLKVMNAQARGAVGVLIYSDPSDDGSVQGGTYPEGPWRPEFGVQRGSADFLSLCAGDPIRAAGPKTVEEVCGYSRDELIPIIPALPISYGDALPLLQALSGPEAPEDFQGGLDIKYHTGPSLESHVHLKTNNTFTETPIWNVIAKIPGQLAGSEDRPVVMGNHRDAWIFGAADPNSGTAVMLEVARGFGELLKSGWKPLRSIYFGSWSGEEYNMLGSTAWGEMNEDGILKNAIAYLNCDTAVTGNKHFKILASPSLSTLVEDIPRYIQDPVQKRPLSEVFSPSAGLPGSGSDYAVFLDHLGIASTDFSFQIDPDHDYGVYHSIYDSFDWMAKWGDPTFEYHQTAAQYWGVLCLRLADSKYLPFDHVAEASILDTYIDKLEERVTDSNPVDFSSLRSAVAQYAEAAADLERLFQSNTLRGSLADYNDRVALAERLYLVEEGLPLRKWTKNIKQAPGLYLGYDAEEFPGIVHALREEDHDMTVSQIAIAVNCIQKVTNLLKGEMATPEVSNVDLAAWDGWWSLVNKVLNFFESFFS